MYIVAIFIFSLSPTARLHQLSYNCDFMCPQIGLFLWRLKQRLWCAWVFEYPCIVLLLFPGLYCLLFMCIYLGIVTSSWYLFYADLAPSSCISSPFNMPFSFISLDWWGFRYSFGCQSLSRSCRDSIYSPEWMFHLAHGRFSCLSFFASPSLHPRRSNRHCLPWHCESRGYGERGKSLSYEKEKEVKPQRRSRTLFVIGNIFSHSLYLSFSLIHTLCRPTVIKPTPFPLNGKSLKKLFPFVLKPIGECGVGMISFHGICQ